MKLTVEGLLRDDQRRKMLLEPMAPGPTQYDLEELGRLGLKMLELGSPSFGRVLLDLVDAIPDEYLSVWATRSDLPAVIHDLIMARLSN